MMMRTPTGGQIVRVVVQEMVQEMVQVVLDDDDDV